MKNSSSSQSALKLINKRIPDLAKEIRKKQYDFISYLANKNNEDSIFLNYGYASLNGNGNTYKLKKEDQQYKYSIQLYNHIVKDIKLKGLLVLEIGSGRGGGSSFIKRYHLPKKITGLELSTKAVEFCNSYYRIKDLKFIQGDAQKLPFDSDSFDVVVNIESSHCYPELNRFFDEVYRVLKPNGHLLHTDRFIDGEFEYFSKHLNNSKFIINKKENISKNVLKALSLDSKRKIQMIRKLPKYLQNTFEGFTGVKGKSLYNGLRNGGITYYRYVLEKKAL